MDHTLSQECPRCGSRLTEDASGLPVCSNCALRAARPSSFWESQNGGNIVQKYFKNVRRILTEPSAFFREMPVTGGIGGPLAFALITHWLGKFASYLWSLVFGQAVFPTLLRYLDRIQELTRETDSRMPGLEILRDKLSSVSGPGSWISSFFGAASLALDPFITAAGLLFSAAILFIGARLFISQGKNGAPATTYESVLRVLCYASTPAILAFIPMLGGLLATLGTFIVLVIGLRETFNSTTGRAILVAAFPQLLLLGFFLLLAGAFLGLFLSFFASMIA